MLTFDLANKMLYSNAFDTSTNPATHLGSPYEFSVALPMSYSSSSFSSSSGSSTPTGSTPSLRGVPEFPAQLGFALLITSSVVASYVVARRVTPHG